MAETDELTELFEAWREDIESVPFPQFSALLIPRQQRRPQVAAALCAGSGRARVSKTTRLPRS